MKKLSFIAAVLVAFVFQSCNNETSNQDENPVEDTLQVMNDEEVTIFIGLPSPIETSLILQRAGADFNETILNDVNNIDKYSSSLDQALNLGVYSADMCLSSMYNQNQVAIRYLAVTKQLSEELGVMDAVSPETFDRMEDNAQVKDSLMHILSEIIMNAEMTLKENDRAETAAIIITGGWIEGLYITTQIAKNNEPNVELNNLIIDHRLSLESLYKLLNEFKDDDKFPPLIAMVEEIQAVFKKIEVKTSDINIETNADTKQTVIHSTTEATLSPEVFEELCSVIEKIRNKIVAGNITA
ncbi:MAG: hypothetical protein ABIJ16_12200 [Bacteroidota bacterium]